MRLIIDLKTSNTIQNYSTYHTISWFLQNCSLISISHIFCHTHNIKLILVLCIYHKIEKGKLCETDLPLLKNDITTTKAASQNEINSSIPSSIIIKTKTFLTLLLNIESPLILSVIVHFEKPELA